MTSVRILGAEVNSGTTVPNMYGMDNPFILDRVQLDQFQLLDLAMLARDASENTEQGKRFRSVLDHNTIQGLIDMSHSHTKGKTPNPHMPRFYGGGTLIIAKLFLLGLSPTGFGVPDDRAQMEAYRQLADIMGRVACMMALPPELAKVVQEKLTISKSAV